MDADGTNQTRLAGHPAKREYPAWSPNGGKIAFVGGLIGYQDEVYAVNADGTNVTRLTKFFNGETGDRSQFGPPVWSPDGSKIAFLSFTFTCTDASSTADSGSAPAEGLTGIYLTNVDGTGLCKLTSIAEDYKGMSTPTWSPNGTKIAFYDQGAIYLINADGTGRKELIGNINHGTPQNVWSPDGERIAFVDTPETAHQSST